MSIANNKEYVTLMKIMPMATSFLVIGLGNNDSQYSNTYHNVGFLMADAMRNSKTPIEKPDCFMNESGLAVKKIMKKYNATPEELIILHDDSDIMLSEYKISFDRGSAGHKGVQNIVDQLKTKKFWRVRIGIRPQPKNEKAKREKAEAFVLKQIGKKEKTILDAVFKNAIDALTKQKLLLTASHAS